MATYFARKAGNINAADVWATTPTGTASNVFSTFTASDVLMANSFAITINVSTTVAEVRNDLTGGATASGNFILTDGVTLTANVYARAFACVTFSSTYPAQAYIVGNCFGSTNAGNSAHGASNISTGYLYITGNCYGSSGGASFPSNGANNAVGGNLYITGNCYGGTVGAHGAMNAGVGTLTLTGTALGGVGTNTGVQNTSTGSVVIVGQASGGVSGSGVVNASTGSVSITRAVGNAYGPGNTVGLAAAVGASNTGIGVIEIQQLEYGTYGMSPTSGTGIRLKKVGTNAAVFNYADTAGAKTLIDATANAAMPAASDVRSGVSYASGALTGSCAVPAAGSTALGVPVDATFGTAVLTPEAVWGATSRTLTAGAGISASDVWAYNSRTLTTSSGPTAVEIRQEIDANSTKLDAAISSRLASASYTAPTTPPTAAEIATAVEGSLLNEADGQAVLNALVGAIGNTNLSEVSLVAAIRSDIERTGGKLDSVPTAAANASAVWSTASKQITGGTVDTLTNSPSVPSAASIAAATRTELAVELARVDASVSSRMAGSESTKLDAVKVKTDALPIERLQNCATTAIVGNLIAQANS